MTQPSPPAFPPPMVWRALTRYRVPAAIFFVAVLAVVGTATALMPRTYRSQSKLFLRLGRENATLDPTATLGQNAVVAIPLSRESEINSVLEVIRSRVMLEKVVDRLGPAVVLGKAPLGAADPAPPPAVPSRVVDDRYRAVTKLAHSVAVEAAKRANVVQITCEAPSPDVAQAVVSTLVELYLAEHVRINRTPGAHEFLTEQAGLRRAELTRAEDELRVVKEETGVLAPDGQRAHLVEQVAKLEAEAAAVAASVAAAEAEVKALTERLAALPATTVTGSTRGLPNVAADTMRAQLYALQVKELELRAKYPEDHPELALVRRQTAAAEGLVAKEEAAREQVTSGPNRPRQEVETALFKQEAGLAALRARAAALGGLLARQRERLKEFTRDQLRVAKLQREVDLQDASYRRLVEGLERSRIDHGLEVEKISNVSVVQPATFDAKPVRPNRLTNAALGLLAAVGGAVGLALYLDTRRPAPAAGAPPGTVFVATLTPPTDGRAAEQDARPGTKDLTP